MASPSRVSTAMPSGVMITSPPTARGTRSSYPFRLVPLAANRELSNFPSLPAAGGAAGGAGSVWLLLLVLVL